METGTTTSWLAPLATSTRVGCLGLGATERVRSIGPFFGLAETDRVWLVSIPLAVSIAFGIMASTVLVLLVIPCLYSVLADFGLIRQQTNTT